MGLKAVRGWARYLTVTEVLHNTESLRHQGRNPHAPTIQAGTFNHYIGRGP